MYIFRNNKIFLLIIFFQIVNCVVKLPAITFTQTGTAAEKQMLGEDKHLEKDGWIISSIRTSSTGSEIWERETLTDDVSMSVPDEEFLASLKRIAYFAPEESDYKRKGFIGEALDGKLKINSNMKESKYFNEYDSVKDRISETLNLINSSRELILTKRMETLKNEVIEEKKKEEKKNYYLKIYYIMVEDGEFYESSKGKWTKK